MHIAITSVLFDKKPEGICTGRLVRAFLQRGHRVTLLTSSKADTRYTHSNLQLGVYSHRPRSPRALFKLMARLEGGVHNNFYMWTRYVARHDFGGDVPDLFYGRAWPHASLVPAYELAKRYQRPLVLHISDPFPPPNEKDMAFDPDFFQGLNRMVAVATALTFTNEEAIAYQQNFTRFDRERAFVLNHLAPDPMILGGAGKQGHFYFVGGVGPSRSPKPLLQGFALHLQRHPDSRFYFVGALEKYLRPEIEALNLSDKVEVLPFTRDIAAVYRRAGALVSIDAWISDPVFTPTKIVEYLVSDRPVLAVTPPGSPVSKLMARSESTGVTVTDYSPAAVASGFDAILQLPWDADAYARRVHAMGDFTDDVVVNKFENELAARLATVK